MCGNCYRYSGFFCKLWYNVFLSQGCHMITTLLHRTVPEVTEMIFSTSVGKTIALVSIFPCPTNQTLFSLEDYRYTFCISVFVIYALALRRVFFSSFIYLE